MSGRIDGGSVGQSGSMSNFGGSSKNKCDLHATRKNDYNGVAFWQLPKSVAGSTESIQDQASLN